METIRLGSRGAFVEYLQLALSRLGYPVKIDGIFGAETKRAVLLFQTENGLTADGIVGMRTWAKLMPVLRGYTYHIVQSGDTFYSLAEKYYTRPEVIQTANPSVDPERLQIGTRLIIPYGFTLIPTNVHYTYALVKLLIEGLRARYPFLESGSAGTSVMGKNLYYLRLGTGGQEFFYNASHHANEWITTPVLLRFAEEYARAYATRGRIYGLEAVDLFANTSLYLIPLVNPDGVDLVNGAIDKGSIYYKNALTFANNYPQIRFPDGWKANIAGIDPNLSYPALWDRAKEIKFAQGYTSPAPRDYVGRAPLDAKESAAVYNFTRAHDFLLTLSYHTQGKVIYWRFQDYLPPFSEEIALQFADVSGYTLSETPVESSFAGYKDWYIMEYNRPGYTIEAGSGINPLPLSQLSEIYADNIGILALALTTFSGSTD